MLASRKEAATRGVPLAVEGAKAPRRAMIAAFANNKVVFTRCLPGRLRGFLDNLSASLRNATMKSLNCRSEGTGSCCSG